jgi:hypothetical protein
MRSGAWPRLLLLALALGSGCNDGGEPMQAHTESDSGVPVARSVHLGAPCSSNGDCVDEALRCLREESDEFFGGGPNNGLCVADCTDGGQDACVAVDAHAICVRVAEGAGARAFCLPGCVPGGPPDGKCGDRTDLACVPGTQTAAFCQPACETDAACSPRVCDLAIGVCVEPAARTGSLPIGAPCDTSSDECLGACSALDPASTVFACSGGCSLGSIGCNADASGSVLDAYCLLPTSPTSSIGDLGLCIALCDCNDDCGHPALICEDAGEDGKTLTGRAGFCVPGDPAMGGLACL